MSIILAEVILGERANRSIRPVPRFRVEVKQKLRLSREAEAEAEQ